MLATIFAGQAAAQQAIELNCEQFNAENNIRSTEASTFLVNMAAGDRLLIETSDIVGAPGFTITGDINCDGTGSAPTGCNQQSILAAQDQQVTLSLSVTADNDNHFLLGIACGPDVPAPDIPVSGLTPEQVGKNVDRILMQVNRVTTMGASTLANMALNGSLGLNAGMTEITSSSSSGLTGMGDKSNDNDGLKLLGAVSPNEVAIGFEQKLGAMNGLNLADGSNAIVGNVRYYDFDGLLGGDALQGQIGLRHDLGSDRTATVYGSFRNVDVSADRFGIAIDEDSYGVGLLYTGSLNDRLTATASLHYEGGEADITANGAKGTADTSRLSAAIAIKGERALETVLLAPRLVGGLVQFDRDGYTDNAATRINGDNETEHFVEAGMRITPLSVEAGKPNWFLDGSVDYVSETLDGAQTLAGRRISDNDFAGNVEAGLAFSLSNGSKVTLSGGSRGMGREIHSIFGNALIVVPLQKSN